MNQQQPTRPSDDRARTHIKALATEAKTLTEGTTGTTAMPFGSGMLTGLAAAVQILDGDSAEAAMETIVQRLEAAIGKAYLDGQLPAQPPAPPVGLVELLKRTEAHLSALHGSVAWHDNLAANLACSGCELRDAIRTALAADVAALPEPADRAAILADAADCAYRIARRLDDQHHDQRAQGAWDVENVLRAEVRRLAAEASAASDPVAEENARRHKAAIARVDELLADAERVRALYERWVKAGPPPLGAPLARWWDQRLVELREAVLGTKDPS